MKNGIYPIHLTPYGKPRKETEERDPCMEKCKEQEKEKHVIISHPGTREGERSSLLRSVPQIGGQPRGHKAKLQAHQGLTTLKV